MKNLQEPHQELHHSSVSECLPFHRLWWQIHRPIIFLRIKLKVLINAAVRCAAKHLGRDRWIRGWNPNESAADEYNRPLSTSRRSTSKMKSFSIGIAQAHGACRMPSSTLPPKNNKFDNFCFWPRCIQLQSWRTAHLNGKSRARPSNSTNSAGSQL